MHKKICYMLFWNYLYSMQMQSEFSLTFKYTSLFHGFIFFGCSLVICHWLKHVAWQQLSCLLLLLLLIFLVLTTSSFFAVQLMSSFAGMLKVTFTTQTHAFKGIVAWTNNSNMFPYCLFYSHLDWSCTLVLTALVEFLVWMWKLWQIPHSKDPSSLFATHLDLTD